jgi:tetratricopeptide (TPR) repeat protein
MSWSFTSCADRSPPAARRRAATPVLLLLLPALAGAVGCSQVRGRKLIQEGNELYKQGRYGEAVARFERAEALVPELPVLWLNKGYTCRQLIVPGGAGAESRRATDCALAAFKELRRLSPRDPRGEQLYVQTLFDANDFTALEAIFLGRVQAAGGGAADAEAVQGLQQIYFKQGKWAPALFWARKAAEARAGDAEAQYDVGAFIWQILAARGGRNEMAAYDPRTSSVSPPPPPPPVFAVDDVTGALRVQLADEGEGYLQRALALRPSYPDAMTTLALLERQKSFAFFAQPDRWQTAVTAADEWQRKASDARAVGRP